MELLISTQNIYLTLQILSLGFILALSDQNSICLIEKAPLKIYYQLEYVRSREWKFMWENQDVNFPNTTQVSELWTKNCDINGHFSSVKEIEDKVLNVEFKSTFLQSTKTYFCNLKNLKKLILIENGLVNVEDVGLNLTGDWIRNDCGQNINYLNLSSNKFSLLKNYSFFNLVNLTELYLEKCEISSVEILAFANLKSLTILSLQNNKLTKLATQLFTNTLQKNYFDKIDLSNNLLQSIPNFNNLEIYILNISNNNLNTINNFGNYINISFLNLAVNQISYISPDFFTPPKFIKELNLIRNNISNLNRTFSNSKIERFFLDFNKLKILSFDDFPTCVKEITVSHNQIENVTTTLLDRSNWSLQILELNFNKISTLNFYLPISVEGLYMKGNDIRELKFEDIDNFYSSNPNLNDVWLTNNKIELITTEIDANAFFSNELQFKSEKYHIEILLAGNILKCSCENAWLLKNRYPLSKYLIDLQLVQCSSVVNIESEPVNLFSLTKENMFCKSNYNDSNRCLTFHPDEDHFNCIFSCPVPCTCYSTDKYSHAHIMCSNQNLNTFPVIRDETQMKLTKYLILHLDGNNYPKIQHQDFLNFSNLHQLFLNYSKISKIEKYAFDPLWTLEVLNLQDNKMSDVDLDIFRNLTNLQELHLSNNLFTFILPELFYPLLNLEILSLDNNFLSTFNVWQLQPLAQLTLHNNPWSCDCNFVLQFQQYLQNHTSAISNVTTIFCNDIDSVKNIPVLSFNATLCYSPTISQALNTIIIIVVTISVVLALIVILIFVYRKEVQVLLYAHYQIRLFRKQNEVEGKFYDAFISYHNADVQCVLDEFIPHLEGIDNPFKLCVHQRDFLPGPYIQDNIIQAIQESCTTIVLLTEKFIESNWCLYEFKIAHSLMLSGENHRVIIVVMTDVPPHIDEEVKLYMKTNTYLTWNEKLFWKKLQFALSDNKIASSRLRSTELHFVNGYVPR